MPAVLPCLAAVALALLAPAEAQAADAGASRRGQPRTQQEPQGPPALPPASVGEDAPPQTEPAQPPQGEVYVNDRFGYALRRPKDWSFRFEPGLDIVMAPADGRAEIQVVSRTIFDIRFQRVPEGPMTIDLRTAARTAGEPFASLRRCLPSALREFLQLYWLDAYVAWHTDATAEEYEQFKLESRREVPLRGHGGVELVYTLQGRRRPGMQKIKTVIVAFDERVCQLSYITRSDRFEEDLKAFHAVVNSLYMHRDRG